MTDFLTLVVAERRADAERAKRETSESALLDRGARLRRAARPEAGDDPFTRALRDRRAHGLIGVIAEIKRVSPALGVLGADVDVRALGRAYEAAGAAAISVLCEPRHWGGSLGDLSAVREIVRLPLVCKDVIVDEYQIAQAYAAGADAVLLIAEALDDATLRRLIDRTADLGMGALVEAHEADAFGRVVRTGAPVVGVNARDLRQPTTIRPDRIREVYEVARPDQILVAESGIGSAADLEALPARVDAVLVGTALMRAPDAGRLLRQLTRIERVKGAVV
jgi:indole-3-glycerol phosphate synthase